MRPALGDESRTAEYDVKALAPSVPVLGNIGIWQLRDPDLSARFIALCRALRFDGVTVHLNPAHELAQPEGERDLSGAMDALRRFVDRSPLPVLAKEVGHGFSSESLEQLSRIGLHGLDVAGAGGTNWPLVEAARIPRDDPAHARALDLATRGRDTFSTLLDALPRFPGRIVIAGGGIRCTDDIVKALAMGADLASMAAPFLRSVCRVTGDGHITVDGARADPWMETLSRELRHNIAHTGAASLAELREDEKVTTLE